MRSLSVKLILAFLLVSLVGGALAAVLARQFTVREFNNLVLDRARENFVSKVTTYYESYGTWNGVAMLFEVFGNPGQVFPSKPGDPMILPPAFALTDMDGYVIVSAGEFSTGQKVNTSDLQNGTKITVNNQTVGYVVNTQISPRMDSREQSYVQRTNRALMISAIGAALVSIVLGIILARSLSSPLRALTAAARKVAKGEQVQTLPVKSKDELGELTGAFNQMNSEIAAAAELRKQMTADIAHDLRTPLTVMSGYLEGMREGVLKPNKERFDTMYGEVRHLSRLVDDLRTLSLADAGELSVNRCPTNLAELVKDTATTFKVLAQKDKVSLKVDTEEGLPQVNIDPERIGQVLDNLVSNALRYTPEGGRITLSARKEPAGIALSVEDNGTGIALDVLPHVFERFYRGDPARQGDESGLGLAIARSIVELHGGKLTAHSEGIGKGSTFTIHLPSHK
jgi:signal transduction histidine kinase